MDDKRNLLLHNDFLRALRNDDLKAIRLHFSRFSSDEQRRQWLCTPLETGLTILHLALEMNAAADIVSLLIEYGSPLNYASPNGTYPIHMAVEKKNYAVLKEIVDAERSYNSALYHVHIDKQKATTGETALHIATKLANIDIVRFLLKCGANCNIQDKNDLTPLMIAVMNSDKQCVMELLRYGSNLKLRDKHHRNALYMAMKLKNDQDIVRLFTVDKPAVIKRNALEPRHTQEDSPGVNNAPVRIHFAPSVQRKPNEIGISLSDQESDNEEAQAQVQVQSVRDQGDRTFREANIGRTERPPNERVEQKRKVPERDVPSAASTVDVKDMYYNMNSRCKGLCLIISNETYMAPDLRDREGADIDEKRLKTVFSSLGFRVEIHTNLTAAKIYWEMTNVAKEDHSDYDCFVCFFLAHGSKGNLIGIDGKEVPLTDLAKPFTNDYCPSLRGKPKLFFVQACRGETRDFAAGNQFYEHDARDLHATSRGEDLEGVRRALPSVPRFADFLISYATLYGYVAQRHPQKGSVYVQTLCLELEKYGKKLDFHLILTRVHDKIARMEFRDRNGFVTKQMPELRHTLTKEIKF